LAQSWASQLHKQRLFDFGLPGSWQEDASAPWTFGDPTDREHPGRFGNNGDMCDAMDGTDCGSLRAPSDEPNCYASCPFDCARPHSRGSARYDMAHTRLTTSLVREEVGTLCLYTVRATTLQRDRRPTRVPLQHDDAAAPTQRLQLVYERCD
jgi:hypothetical protein